MRGGVTLELQWYCRSTEPSHCMHFVIFSISVSISNDFFVVEDLIHITVITCNNEIFRVYLVMILKTLQNEEHVMTSQ